MRKSIGAGRGTGPSPRRQSGRRSRNSNHKCTGKILAEEAGPASVESLFVVVEEVVVGNFRLSLAACLEIFGGPWTPGEGRLLGWQESDGQGISHATR